MSQDNLFNPSNFQSSGSMYHPDMTMQFAPSVPHRPSAASAIPSSQRNPMFFHNPSISNQEVLIQHQQFMHVYPSSPYERPDSIAGSSTGGNGKQHQTKAERRAEHNAIERARRESLNVKFQQLAFTLPNLQNDTRPSKSTIIDRTLDFVKNAIQKEERYLRRISELEKFNSYLLSESDKRMQHKKSKKTHSSPSPVMSAFDPIAEKEASSVYSDEKIHGFEQNDIQEDDQDEDEDDEDLEEAQPFQESMPMFKMNNSLNQKQQQQSQAQFSRVTTTPPNSAATINISTNINSTPINTINRNNNSNHIPVSQPSVPTMPNTTNWTNCNNTNVIHAQPMVKEEQIPYFQLQQQSLMIQKFQDHTITPPHHATTEQEDFHFNANANMFTMMNNSFIDTNAPPQHHHFMHRR
ncbi:hypothetical protein PS15p_206077 [Mucor circinelloides]